MSRVNLSIFILLFSVEVSGCGLASLDAPSAGPAQLWMRPGATENKIASDSKICSDKVKSLHDSVRFDAYAACMLDRGYKFVPSPQGFQPYCNGFMRSSLACRSAESGFIWPKAD